MIKTYLIRGYIYLCEEKYILFCMESYWFTVQSFVTVHLANLKPNK